MMDKVQKETLPKVAVLGRPNVGKSTLFNRLISKGRWAIVDKTPGVTRDRNYGDVEWQGYNFTLIDTGGFEPIVNKNDLRNKVKSQAEIAVKEGDIILFVLDFKDGITPSDLEIANLLRRSKKKIIPIVNKVDDPRLQDGMGGAGFYRLGLGDPILLSALHGLGVDHLLDEVKKEIFPSIIEAEEETKVAIVGRPNVGKSSLLNSILGEERVIVDEQPGTTRDSIDTIFYRGNQRYLLIDTAGIRRRTKVADDLERFSLRQAIDSLRRAHLVLLIIEVTTGVTRQDKRILKMMESSGCGGIIVVNKWDLSLHKNEEEYRQGILAQIPFIQHLPITFTSALTGEGIEELLDLLGGIVYTHSKKIATPFINQAIQEILRSHSPPTYKGKELKIYYSTQKGVRPPSFILFGNHPQAFSPSYLKCIENELRKRFDLFGTPIRLEVRRKRGKRNA